MAASNIGNKKGPLRRFLTDWFALAWLGGTYLLLATAWVAGRLGGEVVTLLLLGSIPVFWVWLLTTTE